MLPLLVEMSKWSICYVILVQMLMHKTWYGMYYLENHLHTNLSYILLMNAQFSMQAEDTCTRYVMLSLRLMVSLKTCMYY